MDYIRNTFLLDELARLKSFMRNNRDETITFEDKIKDWPRADVQGLLHQYQIARQPPVRKHDGTLYIPEPKKEEFTPQPKIEIGQEVLYIAALCTQHAHGSDPIPAKVTNINEDGSLDVILTPSKFTEEPRFCVTYSTKLVADSDYSHWHEAPKQRCCSYLCPPHLERCARQTNEHGGCHEGDCACELCPTAMKKAPPQMKPAPIRLEIPHLCQMCGGSVTKDLVQNFWNSPVKEFRAFMGRCGSCFDKMRLVWDREDREEDQ